MKISSPVHLAGVRLGNSLMNGAYIGSKSLEDVESLSHSSCGAIVVGSISIKPREANEGHGYWQHRERFYSLNSFGMPNGGLPYFKGALPAMVELAHGQKKPLIANVVGFAPEEFVTLIRFVEKSGADIVELNLGCPNVWDSTGKQKKIMSYHPALVKEVLDLIGPAKTHIPISLKLSPLPPDILAEVAGVIADSGIVNMVTATNSYPNALTSTGTSVGDETALAGLTGRALKPISLGMVQQLRALLPRDIDIIGCGGISSYNDASDYLTAGAKAVQMATVLLNEGNSAFGKLLYQEKTI